MLCVLYPEREAVVWCCFRGRSDGIVVLSLGLQAVERTRIKRTIYVGTSRPGFSVFHSITFAVQHGGGRDVEGG